MDKVIPRLHMILLSTWSLDAIIVNDVSLQKPYEKYLYDDFVKSELTRYDDETQYRIMERFFTRYGDELREKHNESFKLFLKVVNATPNRLLPKTILDRIHKLRSQHLVNYEPPKQQSKPTIPKVVLQSQSIHQTLYEHYKSNATTEDEIMTRLRQHIKDNPKKAQRNTIYKLIDHITNNDARKYRNDHANDFIIGGHSFNDWYFIYLDLRDSMNEIEMPEVEQVHTNMNSSLLYPFKSKLTAYNKLRTRDAALETQTKDYKIKTVNKLSLPSFSLTRGCWEMDFAFSSKNKHVIPMYRGLYLVIINVNTKYVVFFKCPDKSESSVMRALRHLTSNFQVNHLRGDGEKSFDSELMNNFYKHHNITTYFNKSKFTLHNKVIDRVIRTIRDGLQVNINFENDRLVQKVVNYYNNTPHTGFRKVFDLKPLPTPTEMMDNEFLEHIYIKFKSEQANEIFALRKMKGLTFQPDDRVICYVNFSKTGFGFMKKRKTFEFKGTFIKYINDTNGLVKLDNEFKTSKGKIIQTIALPLMYIKHI